MRRTILAALLWCGCGLSCFAEPFTVHFKLLAFTEEGAKNLGYSWGEKRPLSGARIAHDGITPSLTPEMRSYTPFAQANVLDFIERSGQSVVLLESTRTTEFGAPVVFDGTDYFESRGENGEIYPWPVGTKVTIDSLIAEVVEGRKRLRFRLRIQTYGLKATEEILPEEPLVYREEFWMSEGDVFWLRGCLRIPDSSIKQSSDAGPLVQRYFKAVPKGGGFCGLLVSIEGGDP